MARIAKYTFDSQVTADDFVIGSDSVNKRVKSYSGNLNEGGCIYIPITREII